MKYNVLYHVDHWRNKYTYIIGKYANVIQLFLQTVIKHDLHG